MNKILDNYLFEAFANASDNIFVYVTDMKTDLTRWSKNAVDFFNLPGEYLTGVASMWISYVHPDDRQVFLDDISSVFAQKKDHHNCQYRVRNRFGEYVWVECRGSIIADEDGDPIVFAGIMTWLDNQNKYDSLTHFLTGYELLCREVAEDGVLMLVGIDGLRNVNSQHGIVFGNKIIKKLAQILFKYAPDAVLYRFQGDEFAVYGKGFTCAKMVEIFYKAQDECTKAGNVDGLVNFHISAGIVEFKAGADIADLLGHAQLSISYAKESTSTSIVTYSRDIEKMRNRKNRVSEKLLHSIKNDFKGFYLVFQPILSNAGDYVRGCEALLRWKTDDAEIGACYPDEFINILENNGGINEVGYFVMQESIKQLSKWQKKYKQFSVSFNVSYLQLEDPKFIPKVIETVRKYKVKPQSVIVELTESILAADMVVVKNSFDALKANGIQIALDDFGTGNSSFWMLHNIDVDIIKLDQSFIRGLSTNGTGIDYAIIESVGLLCDRIGFMTVAEGVETDEIWDLIREFKFTGLQGYLFSKPVEVKEFEQLLTDYNMNMSEADKLKFNYENLVGEAKQALRGVDIKCIRIPLAVEFDIEGKGEGAFYVKLTVKGVVVEPYEYYDHDFRVRTDADTVLNILRGKLSLDDAVADGKAVIEGDDGKVKLLCRYLDRKNEELA